MVSKLRDGDVVDRIMEYLDKGINVVLEFGQQTSMLCYLLVANIIARRIHEMYVKKSERSLRHPAPGRSAASAHDYH